MMDIALLTILFGIFLALMLVNQRFKYVGFFASIGMILLSFFLFNAPITAQIGYATAINETTNATITTFIYEPIDGLLNYAIALILVGVGLIGVLRCAIEV